MRCPPYQDKTKKKPAAIETKNENKTKNINSETKQMDETRNATDAEAAEAAADAKAAEELDRLLLQTPEEMNAEAWSATAREMLNAAKTVYLVSDETDVMRLIQYSTPALAVSPGNLALLLDVIRGGVIAERLFVPKPGRQNKRKPDYTPAGIGKMLETKLEAENIPIKVYGCTIPDDLKSIDEYAQKAPGAFPAWLRENEAVLEREREEYQQQTTGAGRLAGLLDYIKESKSRPIISTGFPTLDLELGDGGSIPGGLTAGLYTIGAISSLGKTTFVMQMADSIAAEGKDVLVIALEMAAFELMAKSISRITTETARNPGDRKTVQGILQGARWTRYSESERQTIEEATAKYKDLAKHLYFMEGIGNIGVNEIRRAIMRHIEMRGETPVLIVDYLQILAPADPHATDKTNTDKAVLEMKRISRDYNTPVICISSFNRDNYSERVSMKALKESGAIEYSSDVVIGLQLKGAGDKMFDVDKAKSKDPREIEAVILKNRSGRTGKTVQFEYDPRFNLFRDVMNGHRYSKEDLPDFSALNKGRNR